MFFLPLVLALFSGLALSLDAGESAPDFQGISSQGLMRLADYRGRSSVVLALYFAAFTPV